MIRFLTLLSIALALFAVGTAGCAMLDQAFLKQQSEQLAQARALYLEAAIAAGTEAKANGTVDPDELVLLMRDAGETAARAHLKARAYDQFVEDLKTKGPKVAEDALSGNYLGAGAGSLSILMQLVLAFWQRGRNQQLAAGISATMSPQAAAILTGNPGAVVALSPAVATAVALPPGTAIPTGALPTTG